MLALNCIMDTATEKVSLLAHFMVINLTLKQAAVWMAIIIKYPIIYLKKKMVNCGSVGNPINYLITNLE
jgi:hypothetical protein